MVYYINKFRLCCVRRNNMKTNYHTHNERCRHAFGSVWDYAKEAYGKQFDIIGMSDHLPYKDCDYGYRMDYWELDDYIEDVKKVASYYEGKMKVLLSFEAEYLERYNEYYEELLTVRGAQYLVLGQHFYDGGNNTVRYTYQMEHSGDYIQYANTLSKAMKTGYFSILAHPDIFMVHDFGWDDNCRKAADIIVDAATATGTIIELNGNGVRRGKDNFSDAYRYPYPHEKFFEVVSNARLPVMINSDCHKPEELDDEAMATARELAKEWRLNVIDCC